MLHAAPPLTEGTVGCSSFSLQQELLFVRTQRERLLSDLADALNRLHGTRHSLRFWRIVVGPWLNNFVPFVLAELRPDSLGEARVVSRAVPATFDDFSTRTFLFDYAALVAQDVRGRSDLQNEVPSRHPLAGTRSTGWRRRLAKWLRRLHWLAQGALPRRVTIVVRDGYFSSRTAWRVWWLGRGRIRFDRRDSDWQPDHLTVDCAIRSELASSLLRGSSAPEAAIRRLIPLHLPKIYLEGFKLLCGQADKRGRRLAAVYFTCNAHWHDEVFKLQAARAVEAGASFIVGQHGANYGVVKDLLVEEFERSVSDRFVTWGWTEDSHTIPMPATKLIDLRAQLGTPITEEIIFTATTTIANGAITDPYTPPLFDEYLAWQLRFIGALPKALRSRLRFRVLRDWNRNFWAPLVRAFPEVMIENAYQCHTTFIERLAASRLFVCDYIGTSYAEALAANKPTVLFWDPQVMKLRATAAPYFNALHEASILHYEPEVAAREVETAYADVDTWWGKPQRVSAVSSLQKAFLRQSDDAGREWAEFLLREARAV